jgi:hypothetical protein
MQTFRSLPFYRYKYLAISFSSRLLPSNFLPSSLFSRFFFAIILDRNLSPHHTQIKPKLSSKNLKWLHASSTSSAAPHWPSPTVSDLPQYLQSQSNIISVIEPPAAAVEPRAIPVANSK